MGGWAEIVEQIRADNVSGAMELCLKAAEAVEAWASAARPEGALRELASLCAALVEAKPEMASILNLANFVLLRAERCGRPEEVLREAAEAAREFARRAGENTRRAGSNAACLLPEGARVLTHSSSAAVLDALREAKGKVAEVLCTESRPMLEGVSLARRLVSEGLKATVVADALAPFLVRQVDAVLVGADCVRAEGVVNKAGTLALALAARHFGRPIYVVCGSEKFLPPALSLGEFRERPKPPEELLPEPAPGVRALNLYFDLAPLDLFAAVVTEEGPLGPADVRRKLEGAPVARTLPRVLAQAGPARNKGD